MESHTRKRKSNMHLPVTIFIISILCLIVGLIYVLAMKNQVVFEIQDMHGDRGLLSDIRIRGELSDAYHQTNFEISGGEARMTKTRLYDKPVDHLRFNSRYRLPFYYSTKIIEEKEYGLYIWSDLKNIYIHSMEPGDSKHYESASVHPDLFHVDPEKRSFRSLGSGSDEWYYGLTKIGEQHYFIYPNNDDITGTNAIFRLNFEDEGEGASTKVASISLMQNLSNDTDKLQILGLEAVNKQLVLLLLGGEQLVVRSYDPEHGDIIDEQVVEDFFSLLNITDKETEFVYNSHRNYKAFINHEERMLVLGFRRNTELAEQIFLSFHIDEQVKLLNTTISAFPEQSVYDYEAAYKYGKLYVFTNTREERNHASIPYMHQVYLSVYEDSNLLYQGKLITDQNDDFMKFANNRGSISYNLNELRHFYNIKIE